MLENLKKFFSSLNTPDNTASSGPDFKTAVAALLVEVMRSDNEVEQSEQQTLTVLLQKYFDIDEQDVSTLVDAASADLDKSIDYFQFSKQINDHTSAQERIEIIELLWRMAYADGELDKYEEHVIRRVADLLYVSHTDFIQAKLTVTSAQ